MSKSIYQFSKRSICIILCCLIISLGFLGNYEKSYANPVVIGVGVVAVCICLMGATGIYFSSQEDANNAAARFLTKCNDETKEQINNLAKLYLAGKIKTMNASAGMVDALRSFISEMNVTSETGNYADSMLNSTINAVKKELYNGFDLSFINSVSENSFNEMTLSQKITASTNMSSNFEKNCNYIIPNICLINGVITNKSAIEIPLVDYDISNWYIQGHSDYTIKSLEHCFIGKNVDNNYSVYSVCTSNKSEGYFLARCKNIEPLSKPTYYLINEGIGIFIGSYYYDRDWVTTKSVVLSFGANVNHESLDYPQVTSKANSTYFPPSATVNDSLGQGIPINTPAKPITTDIPLNIPTIKDTVVDLPTDATDVRVTDTSGTTTISIAESLSNLLELVKALPISFVSSIENTMGKYFNPSDFKFPDLGKLKGSFEDLTKKFPWCLPFDMARGIKMFLADSANFSFDIKLDTKYFDINHSVDLTPFRIPILFFRFIADFWFGWILISRTRDLIKW